MKKLELNEIMVADNIEVMFENKVILYGAGYYGKKVYEYLRDSGIEIIGFCDSNIMKWGTTYLGITIYSPMELRDLCEKQKIIVVITVNNNVDDILAVMEKYSVKPDLISTMFAVGLGLALHDDCEYFNSDFSKMHRLKTLIWQKGLKNHVEYADIMRTYSACDQILNQNAVLIYQPGKVASSTIRASLELQGIQCTHFHTFKCDKGLLQESIKHGRKIKIITGVREPVSRDVSAYFQIITRWLFAIRKDVLREGIYSAFHSIYEEPGDIDGVVLSSDEFDWFDREINANFGVDIYAYPFDKEKGYSIIRNDNVEVFVYKSEKLNYLENALKDFLGTDSFNLVKANVSSDKKYKYMYEEFNRNAKIDEEYLMRYYDSEKVRHFYSTEELDEMKRRWLKEK